MNSSDKKIAIVIGANRGKEETNTDLGDLRQFHTYSKPGRDPRFQVISTVFIARGKGTPQFGDDAKNLKIFPYEDLLKLGKEAIEKGESSFYCGDNMDIQEMLNGYKEEFWSNWSIVTGISIPSDFQPAYFSCAC